MRWLLIVLIVSVFGLLFASAGVALHIRRQHRKPSTPDNPSGPSLPGKN